MNKSQFLFATVLLLLTMSSLFFTQSSFSSFFIRRLFRVDSKIIGYVNVPNIILMLTLETLGPRTEQECDSTYSFTKNYFCLHYVITRSKKTKSDSDIRKTRNVFKNLRLCGKRKDCTRQSTSILKR